jgi:DNA polymerase III subunit delta'
MSRRKSAGEVPETSATLEAARRVLGGEARWLAAAREAVRRSLLAGRLPHAIILKGSLGAGAGALADWIARLTLCEHPERAPCGACPSCALEAAGNHPDLRRLMPEPGKKQIGVDAVRELIADLALTSFRGRRRVGIVDPADALNTAAANAFLKTLEEPGGGTLLLLVAARTDRLPATILSRCQMIAVPRPDRGSALDFLAAYGKADWAGALDLAHDGPLAALELVERGAAGVAHDMQSLVAALARGGVDLIAAAEICVREHPDLRLAWIERWATDALYAAAGTTAPGLDAAPGLPAATRTRHIEDLFGLLDEARRAQGLLRGSANAQMVFERVLNRLASCVAVARP